jgi:hypothetical protein
MIVPGHPIRQQRHTDSLKLKQSKQCEPAHLQNGWHHHLHIVSVNAGKHDTAHAPAATASAVLRGSSRSGGGGVCAVLTAQKWQTRVHVSPSGMMVAVAAVSSATAAEEHIVQLVC